MVTASASPLAAVGIRRRGRHFMCGSTGSGKSTFAAGLLDSYHRKHPDDVLYIVDPKRRFVPVELEEGHELFPDGYAEVRHGRRDGVSINGRILRKPGWPKEEPAEALLLQDGDAIGDTLEWLYHNATVERPALLYCDESFDFMRHTRADGRLRRLLQQGREIGVGTFIINQRPHWIDATFLSESDTFYIGSLFDYRDRAALIPHIQGTPLRVHLESIMPRYRWLYVDRIDWHRSKIFDLEL